MNKKLLLLFILLTSAMGLKAAGTFSFTSANDGPITLSQGANLNSRYAYGTTSVTPGFYAVNDINGQGNTDKWRLQFGTSDPDGTGAGGYSSKWVIEVFDGFQWTVNYYSNNNSSNFIPPTSGWTDVSGALDNISNINLIQSPTISISPLTLVAATVGVTYSQSITASNGTSPYTYSVTSGSLPAGLSLSSAGVLSGTPTAAGSFNFTITATDASTTAGPYMGTQTYSLTVSAPTITLSPNPTSLPNATAGTSYSQTITASGGSGSYTYTEVGALPTGISLSSGGILSGTTNFSGSYPITITAKDGSPAPGPYTGSQTYTLLVNAPTITLSPGTLSNATVGTAYSQTISATGGFGSYTYSVALGSLPTGLTLNSSTGGLSGTPTTGGNSSFTIKATDSFGNTGSQSYSLTVNAPLTVTTDAGSSSFVTGDNVASTPVVVDAGISVTDGASTTLASATVAITGGFHSGEDILAFTNNGTTMGNIAGSYNPGTGVLTLTSAGATATVTQWQSALQAVTYTDVAITPNNATRTISFTVNDGTNNSNTATRTITVVDTDQTPIVTTTGGTTNYVGGTTAATIDGGITVTDRDNTTQASGTISIGSGFHSGDVLTFVNTSSSTYGNIVGSYNAATGVLTLTSSGATASDVQWSHALSAVTFSAGSSATPGNRTISFAVSDGTKTSAAATDGVNVQAPPTITLSPAGLSPATVGTSYNQTITASGGTAPYSYSTTSGALPAGITLGSSGALSGTPTAGGSFTFTVAAMDASTGTRYTGSKNYTLIVATSLPAANVGVAYSVSIPTSGIAPTPNPYYVSSGSLPAGLSLNSSSGLLSGTPTASGIFNFTIGISQIQSGPILLYYTLTVNAPSIVTTTTGATTYSGSPATIDNGVTVTAAGTSLASAMVSITGNFSSGDAPNFTNQNGITGSYNSTTGALTLSGSASLANYQAALQSVTFSTTSTSTASRTVSFVANDGVSSSAAATKMVNVLSNDATLSALTESAGTLSPAFVSGTTNYLAKVSNAAFSAFITPTANQPNATIKVDGTSVISGLSTTLLIGPHSIIVTAQDGVTTKTYLVTVAKNAVPVVTTSTNPTNGSTTIDNGITVSDADNTTLAGATISITSGFSANDMLFFTNQNGIIGSYNSAMGVLTLTGTATLADYQTALISVIFYGGSAGATSRTVSFVVNDGLDNSAPATKNVTGPIVLSVLAPTPNYYRAGTTLSFTVFMSTPFASGWSYGSSGGVTTNIPITIGTKTVQALYASGFGSSTLTFDYTVVQGDNGSITVGPAIVNNYTQLIGQNGLNADLTLNHITELSGIVVDTQPPTIASITATTPSNTSPTTATSVVYTVTFSEAVSGVNASDFAITATTGTVSGTISSVTGSGTTYTVTVSNITGTGGLRLDLNSSGTGITDLAGNAINVGFTSGDVYTIILPTPTITFNPLPTKTYGDADFDPGATSTNTNTATPITYTSSNTAAATIISGKIHIVGAGTTTITASQAADANYNSAANISQTLTVNPIALTITANAQSKTYGGADPSLTYTFSPALVTGDSFTGSLSRTAGESVGTYAINQGSLALNNNYNLTYTGANLTIGQATLTITADDQTRVYGAANSVLTAHYNGFINGDDVSKLTTAPSLATTATATSAAGSYTITASGAAIPNYTIAYLPGTLAITKAPLTVTANNQSRNYGATNPALTMSYSGFLNGDDASKLSAAPTASTTAGVNTAPGAYPITASGGASPNYIFAYVPGTLTIVPLRNDSLFSLTVNNGRVSLSPDFSSGVYTYSSTVENQVGNINITPQFGPGATAQINGNALTNNSSSGDIPLQVGNNTITVTVTAQDGSQHTYTMNIYRGMPPSAITATNILTPNGDGKNDTWLIKDINLYPDNIVSVYDRAGRLVYSKRGYQNDWDGTAQNGSPLSQGTYYFTVYLGNDKTTLKGFITIIRE